MIFINYFLLLAPFLSSVRAGFANECALVIDSGYSYTHVIPFSQTMPLTAHIKRYESPQKTEFYIIKHQKTHTLTHSHFTLTHNECALIIDGDYSYTHVIRPLICPLSLLSNGT